LLPPPGSTEAVDTKFNLEAHIGEEGNNYSAGEKQSIAVARALVKNSKVVVLVRT
jgi:ATP-binding cassette subfamily C (CFTR/MRP) protein 1